MYDLPPPRGYSGETYRRYDDTQFTVAAKNVASLDHAWQPLGTCP